MKPTKAEREAMKVAAGIYQQIKDERRFKLAYISGDMILALLAREIGKPITPEVTRIKGVPDNTLLMGVDYDIQYGAFVFLLGNLEFESLPEGERPAGLTLYTQVVA